MNYINIISKNLKIVFNDSNKTKLNNTLVTINAYLTPFKKVFLKIHTHKQNE